MGTNGGARPGAGRPPGSINLANRRLKELCQAVTEPAVEELTRISGLLREPILDGAGNPVLVPRLDADGNVMYLPDGKTPMMRAKMRRVGGSASDMARISAISTLLDRGYGKAKQPLANDEDNPLTSVMPSGKIEIEMVPVGMALAADNSDEIISEEEAPTSLPANDQKVA